MIRSTFMSGLALALCVSKPAIAQAPSAPPPASVSVAQYDAGVAAYNRRDFATALLLFQQLANEGAPAAQFNLGKMYENGQGVARDQTVADSWYRAAAGQGYAPAQSALASGAFGAAAAAPHFLPATPDRNAPFSVPAQIAASGAPGQPQLPGGATADAVKNAQFDAGLAAYNRRDFATALRLFQPLADQGDASAEFNIGQMHYAGQRVSQDFAAAASWYRKAADQGFASSQFTLGTMYENGQGVPRDNATAVTWYRKAADQGYASAQSALASGGTGNIAAPGPSNVAHEVIPAAKSVDQPTAPTGSSDPPSSPIGYIVGGLILLGIAWRLWKVFAAIVGGLWKFLGDPYGERAHTESRSNNERTQSEPPPKGERAQPPPDRRGMSEADARSILGVEERASPQEIRAAYMRLIKRVHPDQGGAAGLAAHLNAARDRLLKD